MAPKKKNIVWLASYPKSGNTWVRIFLANYLFNRTTPMPINEVHRLGMGDSIARTYARVAGRPIDPTDPRQTLPLRAGVLRAITNNGADVNLVKTHNARDFAFGTELIPADVTRAAVYILRNPLDVVLSWSRHYGDTPEETVARMARTDNSIAGDTSTVPQFLGSWSAHVAGWTKPARFPVLVLRYEDLHERPRESFARLLDLLGVTLDEERLDRAIRFASFDEVSRQESESQFVEKSATAERFFTAGTAGQWREGLEPALAERLTRDHRKVMKKYGYLA
jgi:hypothetical protein